MRYFGSLIAAVVTLVAVCSSQEPTTSAHHSLMFATVTGVDTEKGKINYRWMMFEPIHVDEVKNVGGKLQVKSFVQFVDVPKKGEFDVQTGSAFDSKGEPIDGKQVLKSLKVGDPILLSSCSGVYGMEKNHLSKVAKGTIIIYHRHRYPVADK